MNKNDNLIPNNLGGHVFPKAICSCTGFSEENLVLAIKKGRFGWFNDWGWGVCLCNFFMLLLSGGTWVAILFGWYASYIIDPPFACHLCGSEIKKSQLRG